MPAPSPAAVQHGQIRLRDASPADLDAARALHQRCSPTSLNQRYVGGHREADSYLGHLLHHRHGHTLAAHTPTGELVGLAHLLWDTADDDAAEIALLVADAWQRRGVGTALLAHLLRLADEAGFATLHALAHTPNPALARSLRSAARATGHRHTQPTAVDGDAVQVHTLHLRRHGEDDGGPERVRLSGPRSRAS
ncbi:GNAT family N-acetyltransferase [Streptomyces sp. 4N509B]|uniref:GNAT family N-acetyltransferase n=1 Tax=Streptomyces sp. 4N509B TaxID=3457413 RepID=UPI003FD4EF1B